MTRRKQVGEPCSKCKRTDVEFYSRTAACKDCVDEKNKRGRNQRQYRLTEDEYEALLNKQNGRCAICGTDDWGSNRRPCVDHDHATGEARGLLCRRCNVGIGMFRDNPALVQSAFGYLQRS